MRAPRSLGTSAVLVACLLVSVVVLWQGFIYSSRGDTPTGSNLLGRPLKVGIVSWPGYAGGIVANKGFKPNETSIFWTKYNLPVEFVLLEDTNIRAKAFGRGDFDIVWTTVDFWANELPGFVEGGIPAKAIMQVDWSRGGDAIVADESIVRVEDLKDKKISLAWLTPSHWLLENALSRSSLSKDDVASIMKTVVRKDASPDARIDFVAGAVDAAVVWEPDVTAAIHKRRGAHVLLSSKSEGYDHLLADCMVAKQDL